MGGTVARGRSTGGHRLSHVGIPGLGSTTTTVQLVDDNHQEHDTQGDSHPYTSRRTGAQRLRRTVIGVSDLFFIPKDAGRWRDKGWALQGRGDIPAHGTCQYAVVELTVQVHCGQVHAVTLWTSLWPFVLRAVHAVSGDCQRIPSHAADEAGERYGAFGSELEVRADAHVQVSHVAHAQGEEI